MCVMCNMAETSLGRSVCFFFFVFFFEKCIFACDIAIMPLPLQYIFLSKNERI